MKQAVTLDLLNITNTMPEIYVVAQLQQAVNDYVKTQSSSSRKSIEGLSMIFALQGMIKDEGYAKVKEEIEITSKGGELLRSVNNKN